MGSPNGIFRCIANITNSGDFYSCSELYKNIPARFPERLSEILHLISFLGWALDSLPCTRVTIWNIQVCFKTSYYLWYIAGLWYQCGEGTSNLWLTARKGSGPKIRQARRRAPSLMWDKRRKKGATVWMTAAAQNMCTIWWFLKGRNMLKLTWDSHNTSSPSEVRTQKGGCSAAYLYKIVRLDFIWVNSHTNKGHKTLGWTVWVRMLFWAPLATNAKHKANLKAQ